MGGEETEISKATTAILLEAANFEPISLLRTSERLALRTEGSNRWEKGVDPHLAGAAATMATRLIVELAGARWTGGADVQATMPEPAVLALRPERTSALLGTEVAPDRQQGDPRRGRFRSRGRRLPRADLACARRHAGDRSRRGGGALRPRRDPIHPAAARRHLRAPDAVAARTTPRRGRARGLRLLGGVHLVVRGDGRAAPAGADLPGGGRASHVARREPRRRGARQRRRRRDRGRALRDRAHVPHRRRAARRALARRGRRRRRPRRREVGRRAAVRGFEGRAVVRTRSGAAAPSRQGGAHRRGLARRASSVGARGDVGRVRARPRRARRAGPGRGDVRGGERLPGGAPGSRLRRRRRRPRGCARRGHARGGRAGASLGARLRRVPRRADRRGEEVARVPHRVRVERAHADRRGGRRRPRPDREALETRFGAVLRA